VVYTHIIFLRISWLKNFENQSTFAKVIIKDDTECTHRHHALQTVNYSVTSRSVCVKCSQKCQTCQYCIYSLIQKWVYRPAMATRWPDKGELWHIYRGRNVGIQPPKLSKFRILAINLPLTGDSFALFLRNSPRL